MLEVTVDKFIFRIPETLLFSDAGVWVAAEGSHARLGLSDFAQQVNGDIAFANVEPVGTEIGVGAVGLRRRRRGPSRDRCARPRIGLP